MVPEGTFESPTSLEGLTLRSQGPEEHRALLRRFGRVGGGLPWSVGRCVLLDRIDTG